MLPVKSVCVYAPATIANVGSGFDVLGAALAPLDGSRWGDCVTLKESSSFVLECFGPFAADLPEEASDNLVLKVKEIFEETHGSELPPVSIQLEKNLPISSGLGSSASSIVAALVAFNAWAGAPFTACELVLLAGRGEALVAGSDHYDNVAACLLGGLRLVGEDGQSHSLLFPKDLVFVVAQLAQQLPTKKAREVLPAMVTLGNAVSHARNLALFIHALQTDNLALLRSSFRDLLAEPYRADLVRGFREAQAAALTAGALGCSLSGSGPAVFALAEHAGAEEVARAISLALAAPGVACEMRLCQLDPLGARLL